MSLTKVQSTKYLVLSTMYHTTVSPPLSFNHRNTVHRNTVFTIYTQVSGCKAHCAM